MKEIENLADKLSLLQGVGNKTALRYAYELLEASQKEREELREAIGELNLIKSCKICNSYTKDEVCEICQEDRIKDKLVVLAYPKDIFKIEKILPNQYYYYVLDGIIDPLNGVGIESLKIKKLSNRLEEKTIEEIILVLPTNNEGELTASYLKKLFEPQNIKFSKLAQGVPIGGDLEYLDELTLLKSIEHRQNF